MSFEHVDKQNSFVEHLPHCKKQLFFSRQITEKFCDVEYDFITNKFHLITSLKRYREEHILIKMMRNFLILPYEIITMFSFTN